VDEQWLPVLGYEGLYEVSSAGQIRSLDRPGKRGQVRRSRILALHPNPGSGYLEAGLSVDGRTRTRRVHQLVAAAFIGPRPPGREVRHLDGDKLNNQAGNLAYSSHSENCLDKGRHGTDYNASKTHCLHGHAFDDANTYTDPDGHRQCRTCSRESKRRSRAEGRAA
jgi:hypothetical protein